MENRKYPIGKFEYGNSYTFQDVRKNIERIAKLPKQLKRAVKKAKSVDLDKKYRPGGWSARQVIHHIADSHINAYIRFKLAATENHPTIRPYDENLWAMLNDGQDAGVKMSIELITALHKRMSYFLESLSESDFQRTYFHPASGRTFTIAEGVALYAWHGKHHLRHIELAVGSEKVDDDESETKLENKPASKIKKTKASSSTKTSSATDKPKAKVKQLKQGLEASSDTPKGKAGRPAKPKAEGITTATAPKGKAGRPAKPKAEGITTATAPKRKAGRPAKPKAEGITTATAPKRNAGRPAKAKVEGIETATAPKRKAVRPAKPKVEGIETATAPKRKAGRPAKAKVEGIETATAPKRKAGRPAKPKVEGIETATAPKRKAGRPAKPKATPDSTEPKRKAGRPKKTVE